MGCNRLCLAMSSARDAERAVPLLRLEGVTRRFGSGDAAVDALRDVWLDVYRGEFLVVVGPSGSGKTTLLNVLGGMDGVTSGRVWFGQSELSAMSPAELVRYRRQRVGFVFQFYNLIPNLTALENVMVAVEISQDPLDPLGALRLVGLAERRDHFPSQLSGGEQQRVAIARAIAKKPELLLCDEPTGALDYPTGIRVLGLLVDLQQRLGTTVVLITHNQAIAPLADRVVRLRSGQVAEVRSNPRRTPAEEIVW